MSSIPPAQSTTQNPALAKAKPKAAPQQSANANANPSVKQNDVERPNMAEMEDDMPGLDSSEHDDVLPLPFPKQRGLEGSGAMKSSTYSVSSSFKSSLSTNASASTNTNPKDQQK